MTTEKQHAGFTLIEVLAAVMILAFVALGILALFPSGYKQITNAGRMSIINHLAQQKMDQLRTLPFNHADLAVGSHPASPEMSFSNYSTQWSTATGPVANSLTVVVTVGFGVYESDGTPIPLNQSLVQKRHEFRTVITD